MSDEVDFVLDTLATVVANQSDPLRRVDRDNNRTYIGSATVANTVDADILRTREGELTRSNYVGASLSEESTSPIGTEYDHAIERTVTVRVEGVHYSDHGHIDPDGVNGVPFDALVAAVRDALLAERTYPSVGSSAGDYHSLLIENYAPDSGSHGDYYRTDFDIVFDGFEDI